MCFRQPGLARLVGRYAFLLKPAVSELDRLPPPSGIAKQNIRRMLQRGRLQDNSRKAAYLEKQTLQLDPREQALLFRALSGAAFAGGVLIDPAFPASIAYLDHDIWGTMLDRRAFQRWLDRDFRKVTKGVLTKNDIVLKRALEPLHEEVAWFNRRGLRLDGRRREVSFEAQQNRESPHIAFITLRTPLGLEVLELSQATGTFTGEFGYVGDVLVRQNFDATSIEVFSYWLSGRLFLSALPPAADEIQFRSELLRLLLPEDTVARVGQDVFAEMYETEAFTDGFGATLMEGMEHLELKTVLDELETGGWMSQELYFPDAAPRPLENIDAAAISDQQLRCFYQDRLARIKRVQFEEVVKRKLARDALNLEAPPRLSFLARNVRTLIVERRMSPAGRLHVIQVDELPLLYIRIAQTVLSVRESPGRLVAATRDFFYDSTQPHPVEHTTEELSIPLAR